MSTVTRSLTRTAAFAMLLGGIALSSPSFAAPLDPSSPSGPPNSTINIDANGHVVSSTPDTSSTNGVYVQQPSGQTAPHHMQQAGAGKHSPEDMRAHVEERIVNLHSKLKITPDEESKWSDVAQAMRDSEANVASLIQERRSNEANMNAVDDMDSYQKIAQAHADGLKKVNDAFSPLYASMSDDQKKNADQVFGGFEGRGEMHKAAYHHKQGTVKAPATK